VRGVSHTPHFESCQLWVSRGNGVAFGSPGSQDETHLECAIMLGRVYLVVFNAVLCAG
jgi:hypothetical protein